MHYASKVSQLIGSTPLVDLSALLNKDAAEYTADGSSICMCEGSNTCACGGIRLLGKYEATNPGGSVKDRVARAILDDAEAQGRLKPGGTIIEPTSGNTGVALAMLAAERGYKLILCMPESMSIERHKLAAAYGAEMVLTPAAAGMQGAVDKAEELHRNTPDSIVAGQFSNAANPLAHYESTGPEVWRDTDGTVDIFVAGVGTGGTVSGTGRFLKERKRAVRVVAVQPEESQVLTGSPASSHGIQGIGANFVPDNYDVQVVDEVLSVSTANARAMKERLATELGLLVGISSGANVAAALELAKRYAQDNGVGANGASVGDAHTDDAAPAGATHACTTIVCVLPDTGERYLSMD